MTPKEFESGAIELDKFDPERAEYAALTTGDNKRRTIAHLPAATRAYWDARATTTKGGLPMSTLRDEPKRRKPVHAPFQGAEGAEGDEGQPVAHRPRNNQHNKPVIRWSEFVGKLPISVISERFGATRGQVGRRHRVLGIKPVPETLEYTEQARARRVAACRANGAIKIAKAKARRLASLDAPPANAPKRGE